MLFCFWYSITAIRTVVEEFVILMIVVEEFVILMIVIIQVIVDASARVV